MKEFTGIIEWIPKERGGRCAPVIFPEPLYRPDIYLEKRIGWSVIFFPIEGEPQNHVRFTFRSPLAPVDKVKSGDVLEINEAGLISARVIVD